MSTTIITYNIFYLLEMMKKFHFTIGSLQKVRFKKVTIGMAVWMVMMIIKQTLQ